MEIAIQTDGESKQKFVRFCILMIITLVAQLPKCDLIVSDHDAAIIK